MDLDVLQDSKKRVGLIVVVVLFLFGALYLSFGRDIVGHAFEAATDPCPLNAKFFVAADGSVGKCVGGFIAKCENGQCPTSLSTADAGGGADGVASEPVCGDGLKEGTEVCDDGDQFNTGTCNAGCSALTRCGDGTVQTPNGAAQNEECDGSTSAVCPTGTQGTPVCTACRVDTSSCQQTAPPPAQAQSPFDITAVGIQNIAPKASNGDWFGFSLTFKDRHTERGYTEDTATLLLNTEARMALTKDGAPFKEVVKKGGFTGQEGSYWIKDSSRFLDFFSMNGAGTYCIDKVSLYYKDFKVNEVLFTQKDCVAMAKVSDASYRYENRLAGICMIYTPHEYDYRQDSASWCPDWPVTTSLDSSNNVKTNYNSYFYSQDGKTYSRFFWDLDLAILDITMIKLTRSLDGQQFDEKEIPFRTDKSTGKTQPRISYHESFHGQRAAPTQSLLERPGKYCIDKISINTKTPECFVWNLQKCITLDSARDALPFRSNFVFASLKDESPPTKVACTPLELQPCTDSDADRVALQDQSFMKGTVGYIEDTATYRSKNFVADKCIIPSSRSNAPNDKCEGTDCGVREEYCDPRANFGHSYSDLNCVWGCQDGACLPEQVKEADVYFASSTPYTAYTTTIVNGQPSTLDEALEPIPARVNDIVQFTATAKNKGNGRGRFTYTFKVYYEGVLVNDNGQPVNYASDDPGTNYFMGNTYVTSPFRIPLGDLEILYPEADATVSDDKKQHYLSLSAFYKKTGKYTVELIAVSKLLDNANREIINIYNNVLTKEINVVASRPPAFNYLAQARKADGSREFMFANGQRVDGADGKQCTKFELLMDQGRLIASPVCRITFSLGSAEASHTYEFSMNSYISSSYLNAKEMTLTLTSPSLTEPIVSICISPQKEGVQSFVCALPSGSGPLSLSSNQQYTVEFKAK